ncbi:hypothetical protein QJS10_CPA02g00715 [Acorus calamus]|uniref:Pathogen-related protein n=1 Tax=Acorus calamus TaxID=4465 RepID=A0AAV9FBL4_ACOCL|nr:hypothetical protein QJS10_CPA02g00715 [Acorus calamus]
MDSSSSHGDKYSSFMYGEGEKNTVWRNGAPPNYDLVNKLFEEGRNQEWPIGSVEEKVQRLVKSWEMEMVYKTRVEDYKTLNLEKFTFSVNGRPSITIAEIRQMLSCRPPCPRSSWYYDPAKETAKSSNDTFTTMFPCGFALEILHVYTGPPEIVYKFRHWGYMEGPFKGRPPSGDLVELIGLAIFTVDEAMRIKKVEFFYDRGEFLSGFLREVSL